MPNLEVWASDVSEAALEIAKNNAVKLLSPKDNLTEPIRFFQGDLFSTLHRTKGSTPPFLIPHFSLIVSNPPYIPTGEIEALSPEVQKEPHLALDGGSDGLDLIRAIIKAAPAHLYPGGGLFMEADPRQMKTIAILLETQGFIDIQNYKDLSGEDRVIGGTMTG
jgi:release factor glutamine methyltransferase